MILEKDVESINDKDLKIFNGLIRKMLARDPNNRPSA